MPLYFAYGSCMNQKDIARTVKAEFVSAGRLNNYKLAFTRYADMRGGGSADVVKSEGSYVEGVILRVPDFKRLDAREGHPYIYKRRKVRIHPVGATSYVYGYTYEVVEKASCEFKPSEHYAGLITAGASQFLSEEYQVALAENLKMERVVQAAKPKVKKTYGLSETYKPYYRSSSYEDYEKPYSLDESYDSNEPYDSESSYGNYSSFRSYSRILDNWLEF